LRVEEALGSAIDLKKKNSDYILGFLLVFAFPFENVNVIKARDYMLGAFDNMVNDGIYDFFCPIQTTSLGNHKELMENHSFENFIKYIEPGI